MLSAIPLRPLLPLALISLSTLTTAQEYTPFNTLNPPCLSLSSLCAGITTFAASACTSFCASCLPTHFASCCHLSTLAQDYCISTAYQDFASTYPSTTITWASYTPPHLSTTSTSTSSFSYLDPCTTEASLLSSCVAATPKLENITTSWEAWASCLCYESGAWRPDAYDGALQTCESFQTTAYPDVWTSFTATATGSFESTPCRSLGDFLVRETGGSGSVSASGEETSGGTSASGTVAETAGASHTGGAGRLGSSKERLGLVGALVVAFVFA